jgi:hypothetical protein
MLRADAVAANAVSATRTPVCERLLRLVRKVFLSPVAFPGRFFPKWTCAERYTLVSVVALAGLSDGCSTVPRRWVGRLLDGLKRECQGAKWEKMCR